jgi:hypothetical protein
MEKQNKQRLEQLVRQGIVPSRKLPMLMQAMTSLQMGKQLTPTERDILAKYMHNMTDIMLKDTTVFNRAKLHTQRTKYQTEDTTVDSLDERNIDGVKVVDGPEDEERMRHAAQTKAKRLSIKKRDKFRLLSPEVKKEKMKAGVEEEVKNMHEHYKNMFEAALEVYGVSNVRDIPADKRKEFFAAVDEAAKMDPVGQEDADVDNDGDSDSSDAYLKKRRKAIAKAMHKEEYTHDDFKKDRIAKVKSTGETGRVVARYRHDDGEIHYTLNHGGDKTSRHPGKNLQVHKEEYTLEEDERKNGESASKITPYQASVLRHEKKRDAAAAKAKERGSKASKLDPDRSFQLSYTGKKPINNPKKYNGEVITDKIRAAAAARRKIENKKIANSAASDAKRDIAADDGRGMAPLKKDEPKPAEPKKQKGRSADHAKHEHIVQQMHKAITVGKPVTFKDGSSHKVDKVHAYKFLHKTMQMKPAERLKAHTDAHASHDNFKKHV